MNFFIFSFCYAFILSDHDNTQHPILIVLGFVLSVETLQSLQMHQINSLNSLGENIIKNKIILSQSASVVSVSFVRIILNIVTP